MNIVSGPYIIAYIYLCYSELSNTHPRVATAQLMVSVFLAVIDAYGKSYTAIAKFFDVVKTP